ncbi:alpha/beta hydrolase [soil metagenome]
MSTTIPHQPETRVAANGIELNYDSFGDPAAPPVVLIMGLGTQMIAWEEAFCEDLAARGRWVIRFDNRDIGRSTKLDALGVPNVPVLVQAALSGKQIQAPYLLSDMAADTIGLLDALDIKTAHIVGASMGGAIAQTLAIEHPARLRTMTAIMASSGAPGLPPPTPEAMMALLTPAPTDKPGFLARYVKTWKLLRGTTAFPLDEARDLAKGERSFDRGISPAGTARQLIAIVASGSRKEALVGVRVPTLVIHGDADPLVPLAHGLDIADTVPGAKRLVIPTMGHALPVSMWPEIIGAIAAHTA